MATIKKEEYISNAARLRGETTPARMLSQKKENLFLEHYKNTLNKSKACRMAGIKDPSQVARHAQKDLVFGAKVLAIKEGRLDDLEEEQWKDATLRPEDRRWVLERQRPEDWSKKSVIGHTGKVEHIHKIEQMTDEQLAELVGQHAIAADYDVDDA